MHAAVENSPIEDKDERDGVDEVAFVLARTHFGRPEEFQYPLSVQLKREISERSLTGKEFFRVARGVQRRVTFYYAIVKLVSVVTLALYIILSSAVIVRFCSAQQQCESNLMSASAASWLRTSWAEDLAMAMISTTGSTPPAESSVVPYILCVLALAAAMYFVLAIARGVAWIPSYVEVRELAGKAVTQYQNLTLRIQQAAERIGGRPDSSREVEMSRNWAKIFVLRARQQEDFDRYNTTVFWKIVANGRDLDLLTGLIKLAALGAATMSLLLLWPRDEPPNTSYFVLLTIQLAAGVAFWLVADQVGKAAWRGVLEHAAQDVDESSVFTIIGEQAGRIVGRARERRL
jgi:hypothetical protein